MLIWLLIGLSIGLLIIGLIFDWIVKKKNLRTDLQDGVQNASEAERIYTEKGLDEVRNQMGSDGDNWGG